MYASIGRRKIAAAIFSVALASNTFVASTAFSASFDCDTPHLKPDEKAICDNRALNDADVRMATTLQLLSGLFAMGARGTLYDEQSAWLKMRQSCGKDIICLKEAYEQRLQQLSRIYQNIKRPL